MRQASPRPSSAVDKPTQEPGDLLNTIIWTLWGSSMAFDLGRLALAFTATSQYSGGFLASPILVFGQVLPLLIWCRITGKMISQTLRGSSTSAWLLVIIFAGSSYAGLAMLAGKPAFWSGFFAQYFGQEFISLIFISSVAQAALVLAVLFRLARPFLDRAAGDALSAPLVLPAAVAGCFTLAYGIQFVLTAIALFNSVATVKGEYDINQLAATFQAQGDAFKGDSDERAKLRALLKHPNPTVRSAAVSRLSSSGVGPQDINAIAEWSRGEFNRVQELLSATPAANLRP